MAETEAVDAVVIGAGMAGLTVARYLARRRLKVALLEAENRAGGVVRTEREAGFVIDAGADSFLSQKPEALALCDELGLSDRLVSTNPGQRTVYVLSGGRLHPMPDGMVLGVPTRPWELLRSDLFSWRGRLRMALEPFVPRRRERGDESIASFFRRRLGQEALERLGEPLLGGIHAGEAERLSLLSTFPRFAEMERKHGSLVIGMRRSLGQSKGRRPGFVSLLGGMGELPEALVKSLPSGCLRLRTPVGMIEMPGPHFVVRGPSQVWRARAVVLAVPAPRAAALLAVPQPAMAGVLQTIEFASTATVVLGFRQTDVMHPLDGYGFVGARSEGRQILACTFVSTKLPARAPAGSVLLRAFMGGAGRADSLAPPDIALVQTAIDELTPVLGLRGAPLLARVFRYRCATPQMHVGHQEKVVTLDRQLGTVPGLFLTGAGLRGAGLPDVIGDAVRTAEAAHAHLTQDTREEEE